MPTHPKPLEDESALSILTEVAVEGTSSLVEAHRALLVLAQQENDLVLKGLKQKVSSFAPAAAMTDFVRRSLNTLVEMQQDLLTTTSKQTMQWLEPGTTTTSDRTAQLIDFAREGVEAFARAQKKFLDAVSEESARAMSGRPGNETLGERADLRQLGRDAGNAFIEAQKRLLEIMSQQVNVNLDAATRASEQIAPSQLSPVAALATDSVKSFFDAESALVDSLTRVQRPKSVQRKKGVKRAARRREKAAV